MNKIVRKSYFKKLLIVTVMVMSGWFVYAGNIDPFKTQVKIVKCYPNPATSIINFEFATSVDKSYTLQIYSFTGKKMTDLQLFSNKVSVTLDNDFYRGIYIYQLHDKTGRIVDTGKFQVVR
jgi:Secretion system C-terminal sorting domain